jgi:deoxyribose-phosphate aldolase
MTSTLEKKWDLIEKALPNEPIPLEKIFSVLDLTRLDEQASSEDLEHLAKTAHREHVAAICVFPQHLQYIPKLDSIQRATVVNFPGGNQVHQKVLQDIEHAIMQQQADEIDYVFAYTAYLHGQQAEALAWCHEAYQLCQTHGRLLKVILETGAIPTPTMVYQLSTDVIHAGCDMLKTSTGKIAVGATLPAVFAMLTAIQDHKPSCGIKCSGGIKTVAQASRFIHLAEQVLDKKVDKSWFRIGASTLKSVEN